MSDRANNGEAIRDAFLNRVQQVMRARDLSQAELARLLRPHVASQAALTHWFTRGAVPRAEVVMLLPGVLNVNAHWLLTGEGSPQLGTPVGSEDAAERDLQMWRMGWSAACAEFARRHLQVVNDEEKLRPGHREPKHPVMDLAATASWIRERGTPKASKPSP